MSGSGPSTEWTTPTPPITAAAPPDDLVESREEFVLAVDNAYHALHGRDIAKLQGLMTQMDALTAEAEKSPGLVELATCWRRMRLLLNLIDIESEGT